MRTAFPVQTFLLLVACIALAGPTHKATAQDDTLGLAIDLQTLTDTILPAQPVRLIGRLRVVGEEPVQGAIAFDPSLGRTRLIVTGERGETDVNLSDHVLSASLPGDWVPPAQAHVYEPGLEKVIDVLVLYDPRALTYLFEEPGDYTLRLSTPVFIGSDLESYRAVAIRSNPARLTVAEPEGAERPASQMWRLPWGMPRPIDARGAGGGFSSWPNTSYGQYARFAISGWDEINQVERIRILEELAREGPPRQIADVVLLRLSELLFAEEDFAAAAEWATRAEQLTDMPQHVRARATALRQQAERRLGQGAG